MKLNRRYSTLLFGVFVSLAMSFSMSLTLTLINLGFAPDFFEKWITGFAIGFVVSVPTSLIVIPIVRKTVEKLTSE